MAAQAKRKKEARTSLVRIVSLSLAGLMLLSIIFASVWQWYHTDRTNAGAKGQFLCPGIFYSFSPASGARGISNQKVLPSPSLLSTP